MSMNAGIVVPSGRTPAACDLREHDVESIHLQKTYPSKLGSYAPVAEPGLMKNLP